MAAFQQAVLTVGDPTADDPTAGDPMVGDPMVGDPMVGDPTVGDLTVGDLTVGDPMKGAPRGAALTTMVRTGVRHAAMNLMADVGRTTAALPDATTNR